MGPAAAEGVTTRVIVDAIFGLFLSLGGVIFGLFPSFTAPLTDTQLSSGADSIATPLSIVNRWVNVSLLLTVMGVFAAAALVWVAVKGVTWTAAHIPWIGTGSDE